MKQYWLLFCLFAILLPGSLAFNKKQPTHSDKANSFINSLTAAQKKEAVLPFYGMDGREWNFVPNSTSHPPGIALKDMSSQQKEKAYDLMQSYLSEKGYQKARNIMDLEYILQVLEPNNPGRIPGNYVMIIYGTPHPDSNWAWAFQGHHVIFHFTVVKDKVAFAPFFLGSNPGEVMDGPKKGLRILHEEEDLAYELMKSFSEKQKAKAIFLSRAPAEIFTGAAKKVSQLESAGISMKEVTAAQKTILHKMLMAYLSAMPQELANQRYKKIQAEDLDDIEFAWAGSTTRHEPHYYRVQGKTFLIEFDNTQNNANHIHTVWRDFNGDFGRDLLQDHYKHSHH